MKLKISDEAFDYLLIQRGEVFDAFSRGGRAEWERAYAESLKSILHSVSAALPEKCEKLLDVGSGLGGIDILLRRYFGGCGVHLLDGRDDPPVVRSHAKTFSNARVARAFHEDNGDPHVVCLAPGEPLQGPYDLIVSFAAFAFHVVPSDYLREIVAASHPDTVFIFDVRLARRDWLEELCLTLGKPQVLLREKKYVRLAWRGTRTSSSSQADTASLPTTSQT